MQVFESGFRPVPVSDKECWQPLEEVPRMHLPCEFLSTVLLPKSHATGFDLPPVCINECRPACAFGWSSSIFSTSGRASSSATSRCLTSRPSVVIAAQYSRAWGMGCCSRGQDGSMLLAPSAWPVVGPWLRWENQQQEIGRDGYTFLQSGWTGGAQR